MLRFYILPLLVLISACVSEKNPSFTGTWFHADQSGDSIGGRQIILEQSQDLTVLGEWNEGTSTGSGGSGKVRGRVHNNKLFLSYCSEGDINWYRLCPEYTDSKSYFIRKNNKLFEYYQVGSKEDSYKQGDVFKLIKRR